MDKRAALVIVIVVSLALASCNISFQTEEGQNAQIIQQEEMPSSDNLLSEEIDLPSLPSEEYPQMTENEPLPEENIEEYKGYIIEFEGTPAALTYQSRSNVKSMSAQELKMEVSSLEDNSNRLIDLINSELNKEKNTGAQGLSTENEGIKVEKYYHTLFYGVAADISDEQAAVIQRAIERGDLHGVKITPNHKVEGLLQQSVPLLNADDVWTLNAAGNTCTNPSECLTGKGIKVAVIDTGINYSHNDFGNCNPTIVPVIEYPIIPITSPNFPNDYPNNLNQTSTITQPGYNEISVYFENFSTQGSSSWYYDYVEILDGNDIPQKRYYGTYSDPFWSIPIKGNTIKIRLVTDGSITRSGFKISKVRSAGANYTLDWSNCARIKGGWDFVNDDPDPKDDNGHGTHCAGIIGANGILKGVAPDSQLYIYKALASNNNGYVDNIIESIERAKDPNMDGIYSDSVDIISMSIGATEDPDDPLAKAADNAVSSGIVVIAAAGNNGPDAETIKSPGCARNVITVGATYKQNYFGNPGYDDINPVVDQIAHFSSRGPVRWYNGSGYQILEKPDLVAPGAIINSTWYNGRYNSIAGTSMATPMVAGAAALLLQAHPDWTPEQVKIFLKNSTIDLRYINSSYTVNDQGTGRLDILMHIKSNITLPIQLVCNDTDGTNFETFGYVINNTGRYNDNCVDAHTLTEYYCVGNQTYSTIFSCWNGFNCSGGMCVNLSLPIPICNDTDGGINTSVIGQVIFNNTNYPDICTNGTNLREYYCLNDSVAILNIPCVYGCTSSRCGISNIYQCNDSDGGLNSYVYGRIDVIKYGISSFLVDSCAIKTGDYSYNSGMSSCTGSNCGVLEAHCGNTSDGIYLPNNIVNSDFILCSNGCLNGACINQTPPINNTPINITELCVDTDSRNYLTYGSITLKEGRVLVDTCIDVNTLKEYYCSPGASSSYSADIITCSNLYGSYYRCYNHKCTDCVSNDCGTALSGSFLGNIGDINTEYIALFGVLLIIIMFIISMIYLNLNDKKILIKMNKLDDLLRK